MACFLGESGCPQPLATDYVRLLRDGHKRFGGDRRAAVAWLVAAGLAAQDRALSDSLRSLGGSGAIVPLAEDPGPMPPPATLEDLHQVEANELPFSPPTGEAPR